MEKDEKGRSEDQFEEHQSDDLVDFLSSFDSLTRKPEEVLKGNRLPAHFDFHSPAYGRCNKKAAADAVKAARDHNLQSPRFEAMRGKWSDKQQSMLLIPVSHYVEGDPELYRVTWAADGSELRIDLAEALVPKQWATPRGWIRRVSCQLRRNLPLVGTALLLNMADGVLREDSEVERQRARRKEAREAAKQAKEAATGAQQAIAANGPAAPGAVQASAANGPAAPGAAQATTATSSAAFGAAQATAHMEPTAAPPASHGAAEKAVHQPAPNPKAAGGKAE